MDARRDRQPFRGAPLGSDTCSQSRMCLIDLRPDVATISWPDEDNPYHIIRAGKFANTSNSFFKQNANQIVFDLALRNNRSFFGPFDQNTAIYPVDPIRYFRNVRNKKIRQSPVCLPPVIVLVLISSYTHTIE